MRFEAIIVGQNENVDFASGNRSCQTICSRFSATGTGYLLLPLGTVTVTLFVVALPDASVAWTTIV